MRGMVPGELTLRMVDMFRYIKYVSALSDVYAHCRQALIAYGVATFKHDVGGEPRGRRADWRCEYP
jgi:hypothetical protein